MMSTPPTSTLDLIRQRQHDHQLFLRNLESIQSFDIYDEPTSLKMEEEVITTPPILTTATLTQPRPFAHLTAELPQTVQIPIDRFGRRIDPNALTTAIIDQQLQTVTPLPTSAPSLVSAPSSSSTSMLEDIPPLPLLPSISNSEEQLPRLERGDSSNNMMQVEQTMSNFTSAPTAANSITQPAPAVPTPRFVTEICLPTAPPQLSSRLQQWLDQLRRYHASHTTQIRGIRDNLERLEEHAMEQQSWHQMEQEPIPISIPPPILNPSIAPLSTSPTDAPSLSPPIARALLTKYVGLVSSQYFASSKSHALAALVEVVESKMVELGRAIQAEDERERKMTLNQARRTTKKRSLASLRQPLEDHTEIWSEESNQLRTLHTRLATCADRLDHERDSKRRAEEEAIRRRIEEEESRRRFEMEQQQLLQQHQQQEEERRKRYDEEQQRQQQQQQQEMQSHPMMIAQDPHSHLDVLRLDSSNPIPSLDGAFDFSIGPIGDISMGATLNM